VLSVREVDIDQAAGNGTGMLAAVVPNQGIADFVFPQGPFVG